MSLVPGIAGRARVKVKGSDPHLSPPTLPLNLPVRVQLQAASGECWETIYSSARVNDTTRFKAVVP